MRMKPLLSAQPARSKRWREANFDALPDGKELAATLMKAKKVKDGNSSDLLLEKEGEGATDLAAAFSLPVPSSTSRISPDLGLNNESAIERKRKAPEAINPDKILNATIETKDDLNPEGKNSWHTLFKEPEESFIFRRKEIPWEKLRLLRVQWVNSCLKEPIGQIRIVVLFFYREFMKFV